VGTESELLAHGRRRLIVQGHEEPGREVEACRDVDRVLQDDRLSERSERKLVSGAMVIVAVGRTVGDDYLWVQAERPDGANRLPVRGQVTVREPHEMDRLGVDSELSRRPDRLSVPCIRGGVVGQHQDLDPMTCSPDSLDEDAGAKLDVIVMAADEREIQHSRYPLVRGEPNAV
jgi:hypothetical protein